MIEIRDFESSIHDSEAWLDDLRRRLRWEHIDRVYLAFRATLHALRDHLPLDAAVRLGAVLPHLLRGIYYEGWHPRGRSTGSPGREAFLSRIHEGVHRDPGIDPEAVSEAILALLAKRLPEAELEEIKAATPASLRGLWPD